MRLVVIYFGWNSSFVDVISCYTVLEGLMWDGKDQTFWYF